MIDQYAKWAGQVCEKLEILLGPNDEAKIAAALRGVAIEALDHAEVVIARAAKKELHKDRRAGVAGARMVIRALSTAIKDPQKGDVKPIKEATQ